MKNIYPERKRTRIIVRVSRRMKDDIKKVARKYGIQETTVIRDTLKDMLEREIYND